MPQLAFHLILCTVIAGAMGGCMSMKGGSSTTLPTSAFFQSDGSERATLRAIASAQEPVAKTCHKGPACEDAYYIRGLIALFENRADAITIFQQLHMAMPASRYDGAVVGWLHVLQDTASLSVSSQAIRDQLRQEVLSTLSIHSDLITARGGKDRDMHIVELSQ